ncbi:MAG: DUF58 domain-containing protein [Betaproteobacteria bacterium]|nr:DUF58 domain-containing protein [Betaproteobacteria bacterium]
MRIRALLAQWLFRHRRDEPSPIVLTQRRIFILPSGAGLLYCLVLATMLLGAINYSLSLGHALVFLLAGLGLVAMVHAFRNLVGLQLSPGRAEPVFAGEIARFPVHVDNARAQPRRALEFAFGKQVGVLLDASFNASLDVPALGRATVAIPYPATARGRLEPGRITLSTRYPLGLFYVWSTPHPAQSCTVYPHPLVTPLPPPAPVADSGQRQGTSGQEDFSGLRQRQPSDPTRHIAWKAVARDSGDRPLLVKQFAGGAADELWLDWDLTPSDPGVETRLSILAGWILAAEEVQARYGLRLPGREIAPAQGAAHRDACLETLALFDLEGESVR